MMSSNKQGWNFENSFIKLPENFFSRISPIPVCQPQLVIFNYELGEELGLNLKKVSQEQLALLFSGNRLPEGAEPIAQAYAGHQFGQFTYLGDGRAHLIGEHITPNGQRVDIQFKGSGKTPYSRRGDGRAALEPMLREYLISEAMYALNIPSSRSLAVITTGESVYREKLVTGAILTRVAASHIRVGSFEYLAAENDQLGIKKLADYVIERHFTPVKQSKSPYIDLLKAVIEKQATLIVDWMRVGFIHGVMNTDNMAVSGETIDYGPCAFMDTYHPETVFSSIDFNGRYRFSNQPIIAQWNLARFAETLLPLLHTDKSSAIQIAEEAINEFTELYQVKWLAMMRQKLGLYGEQQGDLVLIRDLLDWMAQKGKDYTNTFRELSCREKLGGEAYQCNEFQNWYERWQFRIKQNNKSLHSSLQLMRRTNPTVIPRNHKVNQCLEAASKGNLQPFQELLLVVQTPYKESLNIKAYQSPPTPHEQVIQTFCGT